MAPHANIASPANEKSTSTKCTSITSITPKNGCMAVITGKTKPKIEWEPDHSVNTQPKTKTGIVNTN